MFDEKSYLLAKLLEVMDKDQQRAAPVVMDAAIKAVSDSKPDEIKPEDMNPDDIQKYEDKVTAALIKFEDVVKFFKNSVTAKDDFLKNFQQYKDQCIEAVKLIRDNGGEIEKLQSQKQKRDKIRGYVNLAAAAGNLVALLAAVACPLLAVAGVAISTLTNGYLAYDKFFKDEEIELLKQKLKEAETLIREDGKRYSGMRWFTHSAELEKVIESLTNAQTFKQMAQKVEEFTKEVKNKDMTDDEFKKNYEDVLDDCMGLMAKDSKMIEEYGKELAPAVMTFVFVVCLLNDNNRYTLNCSLETNLSLSLSGWCNVGAIGLGFLFDIFPLFGCIFNAVCAVLSFREASKAVCAEQIKQIYEAADKIEERFSYIEKVYKETEKYKSDEVSEWKSLGISEIPDDAGELDIKQAVKAYLPEEAQGRIRAMKLPLIANNWLVAVPTKNSERLVGLNEIEIRGKKCEICE